MYRERTSLLALTSQIRSQTDGQITSKLISQIRYIDKSTETYFIHPKLENHAVAALKTVQIRNYAIALIVTKTFKSIYIQKPTKADEITCLMSDFTLASCQTNVSDITVYRGKTTGKPNRQKVNQNSAWLLVPAWRIRCNTGLGERKSWSWQDWTTEPTLVVRIWAFSSLRFTPAMKATSLMSSSSLEGTNQGVLVKHPP